MKKAIDLVINKINERDSIYEQTWKIIPIADLIAQARIKTFRASTILNKDNKDKLLDDLIDGTVYLLFAIERLIECNKTECGKDLRELIEDARKRLEQDKKPTVFETKENPIKHRSRGRPAKSGINWISHDSFQYAVHDNRLLIRIVNKQGKRVWSRNIDYEIIKQLYKNLPDESYTEDIIKVAKELGLNINHKVATFLIRIFANYVDFDAELVKEANKPRPKLKLIKHDFSLADENRKKMELEKTTIGTPYVVGD